MTNDLQLILELSDICLRQAEIIKEQACSIAQLGAIADDEDAAWLEQQRKDILGE